MILLKPGDVVVVDFPGVTGIKRRPAVVVSSDVYHVAGRLSEQDWLAVRAKLGIALAL
jgi:mRNA-degrading endonuclease toxin of MazEF toxin-antitoxin module